MPVPFQMEDQFELLCVRPKETSLAAFHPFSASRTLPPYFVTMIKIPDPIYPNSGFEPEITPGMTAIIDVIGGKRTVLQYILSPIERAQQIAFREK